MVLANPRLKMPDIVKIELYTIGLSGFDFEW